MKLKRRSPQKPTPGSNPKWDFIPIVDADYMIYSCGLAAEYYMKHFYKDEACTEKLESFRYVKDYKAWLAQNDLVLGENVWKQEEYTLDPLENVLHSVKENIIGLWDLFGHKPRLYLTGPTNFREEVAKEIPYKGNRWSKARRDEAREKGEWLEWLDATEEKFTPPQRPTYKPDIIRYMMDNWGAELSDGVEADDVVSSIGVQEFYSHPMVSREQDCRYVLVHEDKDLNMIPGWHYNPKKDILKFTTDLEAWQEWYIQILMGDTNDNIPGLFRVGIKTAEKLIHPCTSTQEMDKVVLDTYLAHKDMEGKTKQEVKDIIKNRGELLWMKRDL